VNDTRRLQRHDRSEIRRLFWRSVSFDPRERDNRGRLRAFRLHYGLDDSIKVVGGYQGQLSDGYGWINLLRPGEPLDDDPSQRTQLSEDQVRYDDGAPWPVGADGRGVSLTRVSPAAFGNAASSWLGQPPSPGFLPGTDIVGDLNHDGQVNAADIDTLCQGIRQGDAALDWNGDGAIDERDLSYFVQSTLGSTIGDANVDGIFNSSDLVLIFQAGEYEDGVANNSTWSDGDWNCDGEFNSRDIVLAFQAGGYVHAAVESDAVERVFDDGLLDLGYDAHYSRQALMALGDEPESDESEPDEWRSVARFRDVRKVASIDQTKVQRR
jgi:hypothetical protein